jgi:hypothetical protein
MNPGEMPLELAVFAIQKRSISGSRFVNNRLAYRDFTGGYEIKMVSLNATWE